MRKLPLRAQAYVLLVVCLGLAAATFVGLAPSPLPLGTSWELALLFVAALLAGSKKVPLFHTDADEESGSLSLGFVLIFLTLLRFGPAGALAVGGANCLMVCRRQPIFQMVFNCALLAVEVAVGSQVFLWFNHGALTLDPIQSLPAVTTSALCFFAVNTGGVSTVIALCTGEPVREVWKGSLLWTAPCYFASACIAAIAVRLIRQDLVGVLPFTVPALYLTYQSYVVYTARAAEKQKNLEALASLFLETVSSLALAIEAKDRHTHRHVQRVQRYAVALARELGVDAAELEAVRAGALLHDIGKLGIPDYILLKPGQLTHDEFDQVKRYPIIGAAILDKVPFPWPVIPAVRSHHERWDGSGYPEGLKGEEIPLVARILAVADVYDALTSTRAYRPALTHAAALATIQSQAGIDFDPAVVAAFGRVAAEAVEALRGDGLLLEVAGDLSRSDAAHEIQRASTELWTLYEVAQGLSAGRGLQETLGLLARKLEAVLPGCACLVLVRESGGLSVRLAVGPNQAAFSGAVARDCAGVSQSVARTRTTYRGPYRPEDLNVVPPPDMAWEPLNAALVVPIVHQGEVLGTINLYHEDPAAFGERDRLLLERIADRAASALYAGILFDQTRSDADTDGLTGLYNVRYVTAQIERRCHGRDSGMPFALLCLDLDSFKPINDNFGHQRGNVVLQDVAALLRSNVRPEDIVARYGGDEFLVLLPGADEARAVALVERLHAAVDAYDTGLVHPRLGALRLGVSIGYACFPGDATDGSDLIARADERMYADKTERKLGRMAGADDLSRRAA